MENSTPNRGEYLDYTFTVGSCDMDVWGYLKPTAILNICQESAYMHSSSLGFGFDTLMERGAAWVLSRAKVEITRLPQWRERIHLRTWHKGQSGLFSLRDYIFYDESGQSIIKVTTSWLIINLATRRITRTDRIFGRDESLQLIEYPHDAIEAEAEKVEMARDMEPADAGEHRVVYSDMDVNRHVNNAKYLEWACDISPRQMQRGSYLSHICINFNHEATFNQMVSLRTAAPTEGCMVAEGRVADKSIFTVELKYSQRDC